MSQQQAPGMAGTGIGPGGLGILSALERSALLHSGTGSAASSGVPSPGQPASPAINKKQRSKVLSLINLKRTWLMSLEPLTHPSSLVLCDFLHHVLCLLCQSLFFRCVHCPFMISCHFRGNIDFNVIKCMKYKLLWQGISSNFCRLVKLPSQKSSLKSLLSQWC